jgi:hypothetical protein
MVLKLDALGSASAVSTMIWPHYFVVLVMSEAVAWLSF